ncbi:MAG: hypothetical protein WBG86_04450 [Polyangiales bacterium]
MQRISISLLSIAFALAVMSPRGVDAQEALRIAPGMQGLLAPTSSDPFLGMRMDQDFATKQKRFAIAGWTLIGAGVVGAALAVPASNWASPSSTSLYNIVDARAYSVGIGMLAASASAIIAGSGVLIARRVQRNRYELRVVAGPSFAGLRGSF